MEDPKYPRFKLLEFDCDYPMIGLARSDQDVSATCTLENGEDSDEVINLLNLILDLKENTESLLNELKTLHPDSRIPSESEVRNTLNLVETSLKRMENG